MAVGMAKGVSTQNRAGDCPAHFLVKRKPDIEIVDLLIKSAPSSVLLLNNEGLSPLDAARKYQASKEVLELLEKAAEDWKKQALDDGWSNFDSSISSLPVPTQETE
eukprot:CAMPEP_0197260564 /NCGR_PEP_ID=MMETSP1429-20130617/84099_1 /TAXON_ID=49237 /ORGANISM="Chaetoceros  sp., Strain UNC1202" /LENGTH=105 /DNA_ID=CAMNT_0042724807 /DNA_START=430 /DNA_END=748 /DNA_ORIENTATION=-